MHQPNELLGKVIQLSLGFRPHVHFHPRLEWNGVYRGSPADDADAVSGFGMRRHLQFAEVCDGISQCKSRTDDTKCAVAMASGSFERDSVALAPYTRVGQTIAGAAFHGHE